MRRSFRFNLADGSIKDLDISKVAKINTERSMFCLEELKDGTYRLLYSPNIVPHLPDVLTIEIIRED